MSQTGADDEFRIREAVGADAQALLPLLEQLGYRAEERALQTRLRCLLADPSVAVLVAESNGRVVGLASMHVMPLIERGPIARLSAIIVAASERRAGIGRALVERVEAEARARGCERLELTTAERRADAHAFYRTLGFQPASQRFIKSLADDAE
jgi:GNAT superfamily N-acetyltransferase